MNSRSPIKTQVSQIVDYWAAHVSECGLSVDWAEAGTRCWRCGCEKHLDRCHIIPDSLGGKDEPSNLVLLCKRCHAEGPNVTDPEIMWAWIRAYGVPFYDTFWSIRGMKEYQFIFKKSVSQELKDILEHAGITPDSEEAQHVMDTYMRDVNQRASTHFGQPYFNTATIAGVYRMMLKALAREYHVSFPLPSNDNGAPKTPWWAETDQ